MLNSICKTAIKRSNFVLKTSGKKDYELVIICLCIELAIFTSLGWPFDIRLYVPLRCFAQLEGLCLKGYIVSLYSESSIVKVLKFLNKYIFI